MSLRSIGRWLYHVVTSSDKRPYIELSLTQLSDEITRASASKESFRLLGILDELTYRVTSTSERDRLRSRISRLILRFEEEQLGSGVSREEIEEFRQKLLRKHADAAEEQLRAKRDAEELARQEAEREQARLAAEEKARLEAEALVDRHISVVRFM